MSTIADLTVGPPTPPQVGVDVGDAEAYELDDVGVDVPHVDEAMVRALVAGMGNAANYVAGDDDVPELWRFTDRELDDLIPPLTRIINRRPALRQAVIRGDEMAVAIVLAGYAGRNYADLKAAQEARGENVTGEAGRGPGAADAHRRGPGAPQGRWDGRPDPGAGHGVSPAAG